MIAIIIFLYNRYYKQAFKVFFTLTCYLVFINPFFFFTNFLFIVCYYLSFTSILLFPISFIIKFSTHLIYGIYYFHLLEFFQSLSGVTLSTFTKMHLRGFVLLLFYKDKDCLSYT